MVTGAAGYVFNTGPQIVAVRGAIVFNNTGLLTAGIAHSTTTSPEKIAIASAGLYLIQFSVSGFGPNQFSVFLNGTSEIVGATYVSGDQYQQNTGLALVVLPANSFLTLQNRADSQVYLQFPQDGQQPSFVNASLFVQKFP
ncbi:hypothetical protein KSB_80980 [Ktedonobacter robiniae]|uniref:C1q domain-containing protein n=2 Tax=Ktedonobacter robiniae TaxID=2778365 RepID=A0ABQ3V3U8_9CHLR|nr:hypothetical protein KSB_80980 [Ktedonobacter robiniae]